VGRFGSTGLPHQKKKKGEGRRGEGRETTEGNNEEDRGEEEEGQKEGKGKRGKGKRTEEKKKRENQRVCCREEPVFLPGDATCAMTTKNDEADARERMALLQDDFQLTQSFHLHTCRTVMPG